MSPNRTRFGWLVLPGIAVVLVMTLFLSRNLRSETSPLLLEPSTTKLAADGVSTARLTLRDTSGQALFAGDVRLEIVEGARRARIAWVRQDGGQVEAGLRTGIQPGRVEVEARAKGFAPVRAHLETVLDASDRAADGTPDFLRLDDQADREAFRRWFTALAEAQAFLPRGQLPAEINDCAALLRFAYREALRPHDGAWASELRLPSLPGAPPVRKYQYPFTPLGAGLFRVKPGAFRREDLSSGAFAQFADAQTLQRLNTHLVSRDVVRAEPGDLLFFRQLEQDLPFHAMIVLGASQLQSGSERWVIYHTGPINGGKGEIRRVRIEDLLRHPSPRWRPVPGNANFLGVHRWNILRRGE